MRLNRFLAAAGFGSRRACDQLIADGAVTLNGRRVEKLATVVAADDDVRVNGRIARVSAPVYILLHKPRGYVVTRADELGRRTVFDLLPPEFSGLFHVGRLDKESEGLLLLTNDGELAQRLTHPAHEVEKEYEVTLDKAFDAAHTAKMLRGFHIEGGRAKFERLQILSANRLRVVLRQGLKRQIRLMFYDLGYEVERLVRVRIGPLRAVQLPVGRFRQLSPFEVRALAEKIPRPAAAKPAPRSRAPRPSAPKPNRRRTLASRRPPTPKS